MSTVAERGKRGKARMASWLQHARDRHPAFDHLLRAYRRFSEQRGNQLAGSVTYFGFLSFFPLLAVAFAILVYVVVVYPDARAQVEQALQQTFPGLIGSGPGKIDLSTTASAGVGAGIIGLLGLIYSGTGWVDALRSALRAMWRQPVREAPNIVFSKAWDLVILVVFGIALVVSVSFSGLATSATRLVLTTVDLDRVPGVSEALAVLAVAVAVCFDVIVFVVLFGLLPGVRTPLRVLFKGSLFGAVGFEVLKLIGTWLIGRTTSNPVYGAFAIMVGLLVWINFVSRITLLAAAWTATGMPAEDAKTPSALPDQVTARLDRLPLREPRSALDAEALRYAERAWIARYAARAGWPAERASQARAAYLDGLGDRLRQAGYPPSAVPARPGSLRDLVHQLRVARRARTFR